MPRAFADYGLDSPEFQGLAIEDPAQFDSLVVRMVEDLDLSLQMTAPYSYSEPDEIPFGGPPPPPLSNEITLQHVNQVIFRTIPFINRADDKRYWPFHAENIAAEVPGEFRSNIRTIVGTYVRGPFAYQPESLERASDLVTSFAYDALSSGAQQARENNTSIVKLRHWLPACERWPYPFNRFC